MSIDEKSLQSTVNRQHQQPANIVIGSLPAEVPPLDSILQWVGYIFRTTGVMPSPADVLAGMGLEGAAATLSEATATFTTTSSASFPSRPTPALGPTAQTPPAFAQPGSGEGSGGSFGSGQTPTAAQMAFSQAVDQNEVVAPTSMLTRESRRNTVSIYFDYADPTTSYYQEAQRLIDEHAIRRVSLLCVRVLAFVLCWCNHPLFTSNGRQGEWMSLAALKSARQLQMRLATFNLCIKELQGAGLLLPGTLQTNVIPEEEFALLKGDLAGLPANQGGGTFWTTRSIERISVFYKLKVKPASILPEFNPFASQRDSRPSQNVGITLGSPGNDLRSTSVAPGTAVGNHVLTRFEFKPAQTETRESLEVVPTSLQRDSQQSEDLACINTLNNINNTNTSVSAIAQKTSSDKPGQEQEQQSAATATDSKQLNFQKKIKQLRNDPNHPEYREKFDYLTSARFEGFSTEDGKTTLDPEGVAELAVRRDITLTEIKERFAQVSEKWQQLGPDMGNPLATFRWAVDHHIDPRPQSAEKQYAKWVERANRKAKSPQQPATTTTTSRRTQAEGNIHNGTTAGANPTSDRNNGGRGSDVGGNGAGASEDSASPAKPPKREGYKFR